MKPTVIRSFGATAPSLPKTDEGTTQGEAASAAAYFRIPRRVTRLLCLNMLASRSRK
jgi:hypothetical protein